jgi:ankyrin repeat protein
MGAQNGFTALHYAVVAENQDLVERLLEAGAFVNQNTEDGAQGPDLTS